MENPQENQTGEEGQQGGDNRLLYIVGGVVILVALAACLITTLAVFRGLRGANTIDDSVASTQTAAAQLTATVPASATLEATAEPTQASTAEPTAEPTEEPCLDKASVADVTIPDDTVLAPGAEFKKTWMFTNRGTCTWTPEYAIVFIDGDAMGGDETPWKLTDADVAPGERVESTVVLVAPQEPGTYRSNWKLQNAAGGQFGWGEGDEENDRAFWVQIVIEGEQPTATPEPDDPSKIGPPPVDGLEDPDWRFDPNANWSFSGDNLEASMRDGELRLVSPEIIQQDRWYVPMTTSLEDFYVESVFRTAQNCSGGDRYGLAVRVSGDYSQVYAFNVSCNGKFRIYKLSPGFASIQDWTDSAAINSGPGQFNRVGVLAEGETFTLYINGQNVARFSDGDLSAGPFGFLIAAGETENFRVFVTDAGYWRLGD